MLRPSLLLTLAAFVALTGCALRPRYNEVVKTATGAEAPNAQEIVFRLVEPKYGAPIAGATVRAGSGKDRAEAKSGPDGRVTLPWTAELAKDNPLVVVVLPGNTPAYRIERVAPEAAPMPEAAPAPEATPPPEATSEAQPEPAPAVNAAEPAPEAQPEPAPEVNAAETSEPAILDGGSAAPSAAPIDAPATDAGTP